MEVVLRKTVAADLEVFFVFQLDAEANYLAAFTAKDPGDRVAYLEKYTKHMNDPAINMKTIVVDGIIAGSIAQFKIDGDAEVTYWIDKNYWGRGVATRALRLLLEEVVVRPVFGRVVFDNVGSQKVLEKCGFVKVGVDRGFANGRGVEVEEVIYVLK